MTRGTRIGIGDFSRMTHLSIKALRHYHRVGLLAPARVDAATGYRYYLEEQLAEAQLIRRFRDLQMPLDEVRSLLAAPDVRSRKALIGAHLDRMQDQLAQAQEAVQSLRSLLEQPDRPISIEHRTVPAHRAVAIVEWVRAADLGPWWSGAFAELRAVAGAGSAGSPGGLFEVELFSEDAGRAVAYIPVDAGVAACGRVQPFTVPAAELAVAVHTGTHHDIDRTYSALGSYVARNELGADGPIRETYLRSRLDTPDSAGWRTEIGWPIVPA